MQVALQLVSISAPNVALASAVKANPWLPKLAEDAIPISADMLKSVRLHAHAVSDQSICQRSGLQGEQCWWMGWIWQLCAASKCIARHQTRRCLCILMPHTALHTIIACNVRHLLAAGYQPLGDSHSNHPSWHDLLGVPIQHYWQPGHPWLRVLARYVPACAACRLHRCIACICSTWLAC